MLDDAQTYGSHPILLRVPSWRRYGSLDHSLPVLLKRVLDVVGAGALLAFFAVPMLLIMSVIASDGGAPIYRQTRVGKHGRLFGCLKFRSMVRDADAVLAHYLSAHPEARAQWDADHKLKDDPRITRLGKLLRKTSLDELPQFINVLKGEMSLVGPRPIVAQEVPKYAGDIAHYYSVRPGLTGLWQVSGRNDVTYDERVQMDSWYVRNWSLWHDVTILCKTVPALLNRSGAY